jgi:hypothetical protein
LGELGGRRRGFFGKRVPLNPHIVSRYLSTYLSAKTPVNPQEALQSAFSSFLTLSVDQALSRAKLPPPSTPFKSEEDLVQSFLQIKDAVSHAFDVTLRFALASKVLVEKLDKVRKDYEKKVWLPALREALDQLEKA